MEMTMRIALLPTLLPLTLAACQVAAPEPRPTPATLRAGCGWSGQPVDVVAASTFPAPMRVIGPGDPVTMDFLPNRLNVTYSEAAW
jgi:hypothetical protein